MSIAPPLLFLNVIENDLELLGQKSSPPTIEMAVISNSCDNTLNGKNISRKKSIMFFNRCFLNNLTNIKR